MSMGSRKVNTEDIDEELLIASIGRRTQDGNTRPAQEPPAVPAEESTGGTEPPAAKEKTSRESSRRKRQEEDYMMFLRRNELKTRQCVYISRDVHSKILKIVNDIAGREITVGGYVDTVLRQHLEQHKEQINELYKKQRDSPARGKYSEKEYERLFIRESGMRARDGKMTYIRRDYHNRIRRIIRVIGHDRLSMSAYIDHVLTLHFGQSDEAIKSLYEKNYEKEYQP